MTANTASTAQNIHLNFLPAPTVSTPPAGVDLWLLDLSEFAKKSHAEFVALLSPDELIRARQIKHNSTHFLATRALLRAVLAHYTDIKPQELLFSRGDHGKPFLNNTPARIYFNLSHCDDLAVLAVSTQGDVGVDIENVNARDYLKIAKRYFHDDEFQALHDCAEAERDILFYKLWTLKEAFFKATGGGISSGLDKIFFQLDENTIKPTFDPLLNTQETEWQFHQELIAANTLVAWVLNSAQAFSHQWFDGNAFLSRVLLDYDSPTASIAAVTNSNSLR